VRSAGCWARGRGWPGGLAFSGGGRIWICGFNLRINSLHPAPCSCTAPPASAPQSQTQAPQTHRLQQRHPDPRAGQLLLPRKHQTHCKSFATCAAASQNLCVLGLHSQLAPCATACSSTRREPGSILTLGTRDRMRSTPRMTASQLRLRPVQACMHGACGKASCTERPHVPKGRCASAFRGSGKNVCSPIATPSPPACSASRMTASVSSTAASACPRSTSIEDTASRWRAYVV
jgi:hypothetical protein